MKGYWYIIPVSVTFSFLTMNLNTYWFLVVFILWLFYLYQGQRLGKFPILLSLTFFLLTTIYIPSIEQLESSTLTFTNKKEVQVTGTITGPIMKSQERVQFLFEDKANEDKIQVVHFLKKDTAAFTNPHQTLKYGASCQITGRMEVPAPPSNPGQFNYKQFLLKEGVQYQIVVEQLSDMECSGSAFFHRFYHLRNILLTYIDKNIPEETSIWLRALLFGDDSLLPNETITLFQRWSLSHLLAISGLHVGLVLGFIYFILVRLSGCTKESAQSILLLFLPIYAVLAGGEPSVIRASAMGFLFIILHKLQVKCSVSDVLSFIFIFLVVFDKYIIYQVGFQFSFLVTFGLILSQQWLRSNHPLFQMLQISFVAQFQILPLQMAYFSTFQPLSILLNVIIVPYFSLFLIPSLFLLLILSPIKSIAALLSLFIHFLQEFMLDFVSKMDHLFHTPLVTGPLPLIIIALYFLCFFQLMKKIHDKDLRTAYCYGILLVIVLIGNALQPYLSDTGYVTMLDVGQGDAFIVELPYRKGVFVIDAGASFSFDNGEATETVYKQVIKPYLLSRGISKIDAIFLTHEDTDHNGSLRFIISEFDVGNVIISNYYELASEEMEVLKQHEVPVMRIDGATTIEIADQPFTVLSPLENYQSSNANSLVMHAKFGEKNWLFTGDIGSNEEKLLLQNYPELKVDVLKVAHHGSNTSTDKEFIGVLQPEYALISVGRNNRYGHPTPDVIGKLETQGPVILRTDSDGAVQFRYKNGKQGTFYRQSP